MNGSTMAAEMAQQPAELSALAARAGEIRALVRSVLPDNPAGLALVARGSSDNAAVHGQYVLTLAARRPVGLLTPSLLTLYHTGIDFTGYLVIGISQSGATPEVVSVLDRARCGGAATLAVTNAGGSPLGAAADATIELDVGPELAVPATKTVTGTVLALSLVAQAIADRAADTSAAVDSVAAVLADPAPADRVADALGEADRVVTVARGHLYPAALEIALKLRETTGVFAQGFSTADLRHGPVAAVTRDVPVITVSSTGPARPDVRAIEHDLTRRTRLLLRMADEPDADLPLPPGVPEPLRTLPAIVRGQQLSLAWSRSRGIDADRPFALTKITET